MGRRSFPGGIITSTETTVNGYGASGMWSTQTHAQKKNSGLWPIPGITPSGPAVGPTIANVSVTDSSYNVINDTPYISSTGGYIKISGTGFASGAVVYVGGSAAVTTSFVSSTEVRAQVAAGATSNAFPVYVVNTDSSVAIKLAAVTYSGLPSWSTAATLSDQVVDSAFSISLSATGDSAITYSLAAGSTLPPGTALSSGGVFSGTVTGLSVDTAYSFSVVANDAENQDSSRTFTVNVSVGDQYFNITPLLLNGESNTWIRDSSVNNAAITISGDTRPVAFSPYNTNWGIYTPGSGSYLTPGANAGYNPGNTGAWTFECFVYPTSSTGGYFYGHGNGAAYGNALAIRYASSQFILDQGDGSASNPVTITSAASYPPGRWYHFSVCKDASNVIRMFVNGVQVGTQTYSGTVAGSGQPFINGIYDNVGFGRAGGQFYLSDIHWVVGTALYTSTPFTPPSTRISAVANTKILIGQSRRFLDTGSLAGTWTVSGTPQIKSFAPFTETDTTTGSGYFDGTGDYLTRTNINFSTNPFTIEGWFYPTTLDANRNFWGMDNGSGSNPKMAMYVNASSQLTIDMGNAGTTQFPIAASLSTNNIIINQWHHIALVRSDLTATGLKLYVNGNVAGTGQLGTNISNITAAFNIAYMGEANGSPFVGYISDFRINNGTAVYTGNFTPTTSSLTSTQSSGSNIAAISDTSTSLLTLQYRQGDNNHRFVDESGIRALTTRAGNASQGSFSPFSPAGWSAYFDGAGDYLAVAGNSNLAFGASNDWTIECWAWFNALGSTQKLYDARPAGTIPGAYPQLFIASNNTLIYYTLQADRIISNSALVANQWYHIVISRVSGTTRMFINGTVQTQTFTDSSTYINGANRPAIGIDANDQSSFALNGYISNLRVLNGTGYTSVTVPTSALTAIANTQLLTLQNNRFVDNSSNAFAITRNGDVKIQAFSPFRPSAAYSPATHGGSVYLDGSGDYVYVTTSPAMTLGTNDHCIEFWMYPNGTQAIYACPWYYDGSIVYYFSVGSNSNESFLLVGGGAPWSLAITILSAEYLKVLNNWTHVVITRTGTAFRVMFNGRLVGYGTTSQSIAAPNPTFSIGWDLTNATTLYKGWLSNFRMINGSVPAAYQTASTTLGTTIFTPPTSVPAFEANTVIAMNFTSSGIVDASARNVIETAGTAKMSNVASKFGIGSINFGTKTDYLAIPATPAIATFAGDFTLEAWVYPADTTLSNSWGIIDARQTSGASAWMWDLDTFSSGWQVRFYNGTSYRSTGRVQAAVWTHVAIVRSGSTMTFYINGSSSGTATVSGTQAGATTNPIYIGSKDNGTASIGTLGYIDDLRITNGIARTITLPTSPFLTK